MKRSIALLVVALAMLVGLPASAVTYDMQSLKGESGFRIEIKSTITTADFIVSPAFGFQRVAFTKGSAFEATAYACETRTYVAAQCASVATLNATNSDIEIKTGRPWIVYDVTAAETGSNISYITSRGHINSAGGSGGSGGGVTVLAAASLPGTGNPALTYRLTDATNGSDCDNIGGGTEQADCRWNGTTYEPTSQGTAGLANIVEDLTPDLGGPLDAASQPISNPSRIGVRNFYVSSDAELATALTALDAGIGQNKQTGGTIYFEGGQYSMSSARALCGDGTAATGRNGVRLVGVGSGYGPANASEFPNGGTVISWTGAGGPMFTVGACSLEVEGIAIDGNGAAANAFDFLDSSGAPIKVSMRGVSMYGFTGFAIQGAQGGQFDESTFENVYIDRSAGAIQIADSQSIGMTLGPKFQVTSMTGSGPFIDVLEGSVLMKDSYCGLTANGQTCIHFGELANQLRIENVQMEGPGFTGLVFIDADDGGVNQTMRELLVNDTQFIINSAGSTALDFYGRGNVEWRNNNLVDTDSGTPDTLAVTIDRDAGASTNRLTAYVQNNWFSNGVGMATFPSRWLPTIDTTVDVQSAVYSANTLPATCSWWEVAKDADAGTGSELYTCSGGTFVRAGSLVGGDISHNGNYVIRVDADSSASNGQFSVLDSANNVLLSLAESASGLGANMIGPLLMTGNITATGTTFTLGSIAANRGSIVLYGGNAAGGLPINVYRVRAPLTGSSDLDFYLPNTAGTSGHALSTDGSGNTSWADYATQAELDAKSVPTTTDNRILRADGTTGDVQESAASVDDTGNISTPGSIASTAGADDSGRKVVLQQNTSALGAPGTEECALGFVDTVLHQHCNGGSLTAVGGGGGLAAGSQRAALRAKPIYYNDFTGGQTVNLGREMMDWLDLSQISTGTTVQVGDDFTVIPQENHPGLVAIRANAAGTANSGILISTAFQGAGTGHIDLDGGEVAEWIFTIQETTGIIARAGFHDAGSATAPDNGIYIELNGDLDADCIAANGGTRTTNTTFATLSADTFYRFEVEVNSDKTSATCKIFNEAGTQVGSTSTVSTNLPADNAITNFALAVTHTAGSANLHLAWVDWAALEFTRSLVR